MHKLWKITAIELVRNVYGLHVRVVRTYIPTGGDGSRAKMYYPTPASLARVLKLFEVEKTEG